MPFFFFPPHWKQNPSVYTGPTFVIHSCLEAKLPNPAELDNAINVWGRKLRVI